MKILLERHGESVSNKGNCFTGLQDVELSVVGMKQAELAANYMVENYTIDKIYSSPMIRARQTAYFVSKKLNEELIIKDDLREFYAGDWEGKNIDDLKTLYPVQYGYWVNDLIKAHPENGQKMSDFYDIKINCFKEILKENKDFDGTILITSHVLSLMCILCEITKKDKNELNNVGYFPNASLFDIDYDYNTNQFNIIKWGYADYLDNLITSVYTDSERNK